MSSRLVGQLIGILTWRRNLYHPRPVVVEVSQLVGNRLVMHWFEASQILKDVEHDGTNSSLTSSLGHKIKVEAFLARNDGIDHCPWWWIICSPACGKESRPDSLVQ